MSLRALLLSALAPLLFIAPARADEEADSAEPPARSGRRRLVLDAEDVGTDVPAPQVEYIISPQAISDRPAPTVREERGPRTSIPRASIRLNYEQAQVSEGEVDAITLRLTFVRSALSGCFLDHLPGGAWGEALLRWEIDQRGEVGAVQLDQPIDEGLAGCLDRELSGVLFSPGQPRSVRYPIGYAVTGDKP